MSANPGALFAQAEINRLQRCDGKPDARVPWNSGREHFAVAPDPGMHIDCVDLAGLVGAFSRATASRDLAKLPPGG